MATDMPAVVFETDQGDAYVLRVCPKCSRFVRADAIRLWVSWGGERVRVEIDCKRCGTQPGSADFL